MAFQGLAETVVAWCRWLLSLLPRQLSPLCVADFCRTSTDLTTAMIASIGKHKRIANGTYSLVELTMLGYGIDWWASETSFRNLKILSDFQVSDFWNLKLENRDVSLDTPKWVSDFRFQSFRFLKLSFRNLNLVLCCCSVSRVDPTHDHTNVVWLVLLCHVWLCIVCHDLVTIVHGLLECLGVYLVCLFVSLCSFCRHDGSSTRATRWKAQAN